MKSLIEKIVLLILYLAITTALSAQTKNEPKKTEPKQVHVELNDGNSVDGKLVARRGDTVVLESETLGFLSLNIKNIKTIDAIKSANERKYLFNNNHAPHGYFGPTAYNFKKGQGAYSNMLLFLSQFGYGFTDHFSVTGGTEFISLLDGEAIPAFFYFNSKFSFSINNELTLGTGAYLFFDTGSGAITDGQIILPIPYVVATLGNRHLTNVSIGVGSPLVVDGKRNFIFLLSGQMRLANKISLMSENYLGGNLNIGTSGFRFMGKNLAFNVGLMYIINNGDSFLGFQRSPIIPIPFLGLNIPFEKRKR